MTPPDPVVAALDRLVGAPAPLLVVADFDGTLAVGTRDPAAAVIHPAARRALRGLARIAEDRPDRLHVAILTGRTVADVASRARVGGIDYLGDHGLQRGRLARGGRATTIRVEVVGTWDREHAAAEALAVGVATDLGHPAWLFVERKGPSVAFHVRQADDVAAARAAVLEAIARVEAREGLVDHGLAPYRGRSVVDLRPVGAGGKGEAVTALTARYRPGAVVSFGDDLSDADAFDAVHAAATEGAARVGIAVAVHGRLPAPPEVLERADLVLGSAGEVGRMLGALARRLRADAD